VAYTRREFLRTGAGGLVAAAATAPRAQAQPERPLNLLYIMTDQQPVRSMGCYGNPLDPTPNLDRLAGEGVRLDNYYIAGFPCSPSRATMITGRYPHGHGIVTNDILLTDDIPNIAHCLSDAGYDTAYIGKWHLGGNMYRGLPGRGSEDGNWHYRRVDHATQFAKEQAEGGFGEDESQVGFAHWIGGWRQYQDYLREVGLGELVDKNPRVGNHNALPSTPEGQHMYSLLPEEHHMAAFFASETCEFLESRRDTDKPFGAVLSFFGPHLPVCPPRPWDEKYGLGDVELPANHVDDLRGKPLTQQRNNRCYKAGQWEEDQYRDYIRRYWGYCAYIDQQIGRVLDTLDECGLAENTIVAFSSDHGDMVGSHGMIFKLGHCGYEELFRVPMIVRAPGVIPAGTSSAALGSNVDMTPTFLDLMGVAGPDGVQGESAADLWTGKSDRGREVAFCDSMEQAFMSREGQWKFVLNLRARDVDELYDLEADPGELRNLATDTKHADQVEHMKTQILDWLHDTDNPYADALAEDAKKTFEMTLIDVWPEVEEFEAIDARTFEMTLLWHVDGPMPDDTKYWSYTQFCNRKYATDGEIAFRFTPWPDPPTTEWKPGETHRIGPVKVEVPEHCGPGKYQVRIGLYSPDAKKGPGILTKGVGNYILAGELTVGDEGISFEATGEE